MIISTTAKKIYRLIILIFCVFASVINADANTHYSSKRIQQLVETLNILRIENDSVIYTKYKNYPVVIETVGDTVVHIGINIFGSELKKSNLLIYRFIEQYLLGAISLGKGNELQKRMYEEGVITIGNLTSIPILTSNVNKISLNLSYKQRDRYNVEWSTGNKSFSMSFPQNYQLLTGNDKIELENNFKHLVLAHKINKTPQQDAGVDTIKVSKDIWAVNKGFYIIEQMRNVRFFTTKTAPNYNYKDSLSTDIPLLESPNKIPNDTLNFVSIIDTIPSGLTDSIITIQPKEIQDIAIQYPAQSCQTDSLILLCDSNHPRESIHNLLSTSSIKNNITVNVTHQKYGFVKEAFECPLSKLINYCLEQGCIPYVGIEGDKSSEHLTAYLTMVQPYHGYNHSLKFTIDRDILHNMSGIISATLNVYIPTHNLSNLYGEKESEI